jgi:hypothetical protein
MGGYAMSRLGVLIIAVFFDLELVSRSYVWVQRLWGADLRTAGNMRGWWLLLALVASVHLSIILGLTYLLLRKWMKVENKLLLISTCTDVSITVILWFLGTVVADLLGGSPSASTVGQCGNLLLWIGTIWIVVTFARHAILSTQVQPRPG